MEERQKSIKIAQRESLLLKEISQLFHNAAMDDARLSGVFINKVGLSADKGICTVYFYTPEGKKKFDEVLSTLILYKPSIRAALAKTVKGRYVPNLKFVFDEQFEKQERVETLLEELKDKGDI